MIDQKSTVIQGGQMRNFIKLCHWLITIFHCVFIYYGLDTVFQQLPENIHADQQLKRIMKMGKSNLWLYFSLWGVVLHIVYFLMVSVLEVFDTVPSLSKMTALIRRVENVRKHLFVSLVFPITLCVSITFWAVYAYDREQVYPIILDKYMSPWINHAIHTVPPVIGLFHMLFIIDATGINTRQCLVMLVCFDVLYDLCFMWSGLVNGNWIYLLCEAISTEKLALALSICNLSTGFYFAMGRFLPNYTKSIRELIMGNNCKKIQ